MTAFISSLVVFALAITGMAAGVILSNRRIKGTCGGLSGMTNSDGQTMCDACITPATDCDRDKSAAASCDSEDARAPFST